MEIKLTATQVITLWETMVYEEELGATESEIASRPISPQTNRLLRSFGVNWVNITPSKCSNEIFTRSKTETKKLKEFFQSCADALNTSEE